MEIVENNTTKKTNDAKVAKLEAKFEKAQKAFETQEYTMEVTKDSMTFLLTDFATNLKFKGYSSYGITEVYNALETLKEDKKTESFKGKFKKEYVEALFHFIREFEGTGLKTAKSHRALSDEVAPVMQKVNQNMQNFKDLATELEAAKQGVEPEELVRAMQAAQSQQGPQ